MHNYANYELFKSITQEHTQYKHITTKHGNQGKHSQVHVKRKFVKKGLITRHGEVVTPKLMVSVKCNTEPLVWLAINHNTKHAVRPKWALVTPE